MASGFLQMFRYARAEKVDAKENFTTEALAANLRYDVSPFLSLLRKRGLIAPHAVVGSEVVVLTQVGYPEAGIIDLVVNLIADGEQRTFWVEVKVDAGEHGQQLTNYLSFLSTQKNTTLLTLGKRALRDDVPHLSWRELHAVARASSAPFWRDFASFLEELGMLDDYDGPLAGDEVASLGTAYALLRKTAHALEEVCKKANLAWPKAAWPETHEDIARMLGVQFRRFGRLTAGSNYPRSPVGVGFGLVRENRSTTGAVLQTWVEIRPKNLPARNVLLAHLRKRPLASLWTSHTEGWVMVRARASVPSDGDPATIRDWFLARLEELASVDLFRVASELAVKTPTVDDTGVDQTGES